MASPYTWAYRSECPMVAWGADSRPFGNDLLSTPGAAFATARAQTAPTPGWWAAEFAGAVDGGRYSLQAGLLDAAGRRPHGPTTGMLHRCASGHDSRCSVSPLASTLVATMLGIGRI
jgi:hypothetical protein